MHSIVSGCAQPARRFLSMSCRISGVKIICMARLILPPGQTIDNLRPGHERIVDYAQQVGKIDPFRIAEADDHKAFTERWDVTGD